MITEYLRAYAPQNYREEQYFHDHAVGCAEGG